jgi:RNA polymerase sigma factor (sigma-70 family)
MIEKYQNIIRAVVVRMAGSTSCSADIDDVVQSVNLRLLEHGMANYDPARGPVESYIAVMARTMTIDAWRRKKRAPLPASDQMDAKENGGYVDGDARPSSISADSITDASDDALAMLIREERRTRLETAIKKLTPDDQHFLLVSMRPDYDNRLYAQRLGVTEVALRVRKFRLAERLRELLAGTQS